MQLVHAAALRSVGAIGRARYAVCPTVNRRLTRLQHKPRLAQQMTTTATFDLEYVRAALSDHEMLSTYSKQFEAVFLAKHAKGIGEAIAALKPLLSQKLVEHFATEDDHIFPALVATNPGEEISRLVTALRKEHEQLLEESHRLIAMLPTRGMVFGQTTTLLGAMVKFFNQWEEHADQEDVLYRLLLAAHTQATV